jgi:hypothetical protein
MYVWEESKKAGKIMGKGRRRNTITRKVKKKR